MQEQGQPLSERLLKDVVGMIAMHDHDGLYQEYHHDAWPPPFKQKEFSTDQCQQGTYVALHKSTRYYLEFSSVTTILTFWGRFGCVELASWLPASGTNE